MKKPLITTVSILLSVSAYAHDFEAVHNGETIYYNITSTTAPSTVDVSYHGTYYKKYAGDVVIPETATYNGTTYSVTAIGDDAFSGCAGLTSVTLAHSVISIEVGAFLDCNNLTQIVSKATTPPTVNGYNSLDGISKATCQLFVPVGSKNAYRTAPEWKDFHKISEIPTNIDTIQPQQRFSPPRSR